MIKRTRSITALLPVIGGLLFLLAASLTKAADRPNVLLIVCDDLNTHVAPAGYEPIHTPVMKQFATEAQTFQRAFCQYPVCGPSRASFMSGLYPESTGVLDNTADIRETRPNTVSLPQYFKQHGYWTGGVGKLFHTRSTTQGTLPGISIYDSIMMSCPMSVLLVRNLRQSTVR